MLSIFLATIGYFFLAVVFILDKLILTKSVSKPAVYTFYSTFFLILMFALWPFGVEILKTNDLFWAIFSGLTFGFGLWTMFIAVKKGETSHISPFIGAIITVVTFLLAYLFLNEKLTATQLTGILMLIIASFILSFEKSKKHNGFHIGFVWAILSGILFATSHVSAKYIYEIYPFLTGIVWTRGTVGLVGLICLFSPSVWKNFLGKKSNRKKAHKKNIATLVITTKILGITGNFLLQYAIAIGSVTIVNALGGLQFILMFLLVYILTKFFKQIFHEYFTHQELATQIFALLIVGAGYILFVI